MLQRGRNIWQKKPLRDFLMQSALFLHPHSAAAAIHTSNNKKPNCSQMHR